MTGCGAPPPTPGAATAQSWVTPAATTGKATLLYAGDLRGDVVNVYDYKGGALVGTLSGFNEPMGGCVDRYGDVFITNWGSAATMEFKNGGQKPIHTYRTPAPQVGCSVDRAGDLAVVEEPLSYGPDGVCVWKGGKGPRACYRNDYDCSIMSSPGYDNQSNLYVEGYYPSGGADVCELPAGGSALRTVTVSGGSLNFQGGVMWDGKYLTLSDPHTGPSHVTTSLYRVTESPSGDLTIVGTTVLNDTCADGNSSVVPFVVGPKNTPVNDREGRTIVGPDTECNQGVIDFWQNPKGGNEVHAWPVPIFAQGVVVSRP